MKSESGSPLPAPGGSEPEGILRAKYLDYCSSQVAEILLLLTPDEMYVLAQDAAREAGVAGEMGYEEIVSLATGRVSRKLALPPFEVWATDYRSNPERYDQYLMGLWESELPTPNEG
ncbi:hypothetical protein ACFL3Z_00400 [Gemmatimonadota bacterium]